MSSVVEIEEALQKLPVQEARKIADWLQNYLNDKWDKQIDENISAGKLDYLADKALQDYHSGQVKPLDEVIDERILKGV
jgi:hypothetical protein